MKEISLTQGKVALVDDDDYDRINQYKWCAVKHRHTFYAIRHIWINGIRTTVKMHREILSLAHGDGVIADHKNRNGIDNQKHNLRKVSASLNAYNRKIPATNTSGYRGVYWNIGCRKWIAMITEHKKLRHLGCFIDPIAAAIAHDMAILKYRGDNALLNFPDNVDEYADEIIGRL